ncbi:MAG: DUF3459 domain-containing protein [Sphingomonadales bacterium]|nr:MAG: DUF3459 domain-containing protein [Sphingomonadales bacterium]
MQEGDPRAVLAFYREALAFRRTSVPIQSGDIHFLDAPDAILAFTRQHGGETTLCLYNLSREPVDWPLPATFTTAIADPVSAPGITMNRKKVRLPALSWAFLR